MAKTVKTIQETKSGRNTKFKDTKTGEKMTRSGFVKKIEKGEYPDYHKMDSHNIKTPRSNPDKRKSNNLG